MEIIQFETTSCTVQPTRDSQWVDKFQIIISKWYFFGYIVCSLQAKCKCNIKSQVHSCRMLLKKNGQPKYLIIFLSGSLILPIFEEYISFFFLPHSSFYSFLITHFPWCFLLFSPNSKVAVRARSFINQRNIWQENISSRFAIHTWIIWLNYQQSFPFQLLGPENQTLFL